MNHIADIAKKSSRLRGMLKAPGLSFLMEAHNGPSAKIAEEAGFEGIWASGLSISAALGIRDNDEASSPRTCSPPSSWRATALRSSAPCVLLLVQMRSPAWPQG